MTNSIVVIAAPAPQASDLAAALGNAGYVAEVAGAPEQALRCLGQGNAGLCLAHSAFADAVLPARGATPIVVFDDHGDVRRAVTAMRSGAIDYVATEAGTGDALSAVAQHYRASQVSEIVQVAASTQRSFALAAKVAQTDVSVLILGESGTGKEVIARYVHQSSPRKDRPYVAVNCAAIPDNMLEAILFGHVKGAFTGAHQSRPGKFELADTGTVLLDEISEMPLALQAKLLRVLQEREVERVGGRQATPVDVRVIATSNVDLSQAIADGRFREDLYYRLSVFPLHLEPLRRRPEDVLALAQHFAAKHGARQGCQAQLSPAAERALCEYDWPGNVRELENTVQRALVLCSGSVIDAADLGLTQSPAPVGERALCDRVRGAEEDAILDALRANGGQRKATAQQLGISERTLRYKLQKLRAAGVKEF